MIAFARTRPPQTTPPPNETGVIFSTPKTWQRAGGGEKRAADSRKGSCGRSFSFRRPSHSKRGRSNTRSSGPSSAFIRAHGEPNTNEDNRPSFKRRRRTARASRRRSGSWRPHSRPSRRNLQQAIKRANQLKCPLKCRILTIVPFVMRMPARVDGLAVGCSCEPGPPQDGGGPIGWADGGSSAPYSRTSEFSL